MAASGVIDLESWRGDLHHLHLTMDQAVQSFIANQTRQLDVVATELSSQMERISVKEQCFTQLSDSIADFVEAEAVRTEMWGLPLADAEADALHESYDAEMPGPPALHRINRHWRKMTKAFDIMKQAKECEASKAMGVEQARAQTLMKAAEDTCATMKHQHAAEMQALEKRLESALGDDLQKNSQVEALTLQLRTLSERNEAVETRVAEVNAQAEQAGAAHNRADYEWEAEREELIRERSEAQDCLAEAEASIDASKKQETDLLRQYAERGDKLEQMKRIMDEQEREMTIKIDRVQAYVKERQASALVAEKKQLDAERMADRWQREVQRLQAEKDRLAATVIEVETHKSSQNMHLHSAQESHQLELSRLQDALGKKDEEMRSANLELLQQRDEEYQSKITHERQREKDRSIALLNKKQQEMQIKEQQLKAARHRIQELESGMPSSAPLGGHGGASPSGSHGSSASRRLAGECREAALPPLPFSAR